MAYNDASDQGISGTNRPPGSPVGSQTRIAVQPGDGWTAVSGTVQYLKSGDVRCY